MTAAHDPASAAALGDENARLHARLREAEETLAALRSGEVDAIVVGDDVYTLQSAQATQWRFHADVLAQMNDAVLLVDPDDHLLFLNPAAERQYETPASQALGRPLADLFEQHWHEPADAAAVRTALDAHGTWRGRSRHVLRSGRALLVETTLSVLREPGGVATGVLSVVRDVTERAAAETALRESQSQLSEADRRKDEFIAMLAHELRNPLAPIRNALQILKLSDTAALKQHAIEVIDRQLKQVVHLVDDLLEVGRIAQGKLLLRRERLALAAVMRGACEASQPQMERKRHHLHVELPADDVCIDGDETRLIQVLNNLLDNAAKYTPEGGRIELVAHVDGTQARIRVRDNGIGIAAPLLPQVFELFMQIGRGIDRSQGGLGIGLALVKRLVELHGGSVEAHSDGEQRGTTMTVTLPIVEAAAPRRLSADASAAPRPSRTAALAIDASASAAKGLRVMVVDDNHDSADSLRTMLDMLGYKTASGHDGEQAVALAEDFRPHLVLMDLGLPRIDGYEAGRRIRARDWAQGVTLVALTGWGQASDRQRSHAAGFDHHFVKPVEPARIVELLDAIARRRG